VSAVDDRQKGRLAQNEDIFREVNDRINATAEGYGADGHVYEFLCECSDPACMERVELTLAQYRHVRDEPTRFVVKTGHAIAEIEHVVETAPDHVVIEKHGEAGRVAIELDAQSDDTA
jgi:hypothetical protein